MTTNNIPEWALDYPQKYVAPDTDTDANPKELLKLLQSIMNQFEDEKKHRPIITFLSRFVSAVAYYYENMVVDIAETVVIVNLCNSASSDWNTYSEILFQGQKELISKYDAMKIPGDAAIMPLCIIDFLRHFQNRQLQEDLLNTITTFIRHPQQNFLLNPEASILTVQSLYRTADIIKDAAQKEYAFFRFYKNLYEALLFYRSALYLGTFLINHGIDNSDLRHIVYMSEEMRVIIWLSIMPVYRDTTPDFLMPEDIFAWLGVITDKKQQNANICSPTPYLIHQYYASLYYPKIYKDIALEVFKISRKMATSTKKLEKYVCKLEEKRNELADEIHVIDFLKRYIKNINEN